MNTTRLRGLLSVAIVSALALGTASCSLIIDSQQFVGPASACAECAGFCANAGSTDEVCCDEDGDGFFPPGVPSACVPATEPDCNDQNIRMFPGAPALCGDGVINDCTPQAAPPPPLSTLRFAEFQQIPPFFVTDDNEPLFDPIIDVALISGVISPGVQELRAVISVVFDDATTGFFLVSPVLTAALEEPLIPIEVVGIDDAPAVTAAVELLDEKLYAAVILEADEFDERSLSLYELTLSEPQQRGDGVVIPATANRLAMTTVGVLSDGEVLVQIASFVDSSGATQPAAVYQAPDGVCRLPAGEEPSCAVSDKIWATPPYFRASGLFSIDEHVRAAGTEPLLIVNSGDDHTDVPVRRPLADETAIAGDWDVAASANGLAVAVPALDSRLQSRLRVLRIPCSGPSASSCDVGAGVVRDDLLAIQNSQVVRIAPFEGGFGLTTIEVPNSTVPPEVMFRIAQMGTSAGLNVVSGVIRMSPPSGETYFNVKSLEMSQRASGNARSLAVVYETDGTGAGSINTATTWFTGLHFCSNE